jgi:hypothetical protein
MNVVLWIIAGLLALAFLGAGTMKIIQPKEKLYAASGPTPSDPPARRELLPGPAAHGPVQGEVDPGPQRAGPGDGQPDRHQESAATKRPKAYLGE